MKRTLDQDSTRFEKLQNSKRIHISQSNNLVYKLLIDGANLENTYLIEDEFTIDSSNIHSEILYKFVLINGADLKAVPKIIVKKGAKNIKTYLSVKCLLVDKKSKAFVLPSLEINENEVKAGHGASIGTLDKRHIYSLMKAGLDAESAEKVLIKAFLA